MTETLERPITVSKPAPVMKENKKVKKMLIICSKGKLEDVYAALVMANGALMEGIEAKMFFTFFGLEAITRKNADHLHTATVGNPALCQACLRWSAVSRALRLLHPT